MKGKLTIVGAGPGDPDLISVKGMKALLRAEVILYDALVAKELLAYAPSGCKKIYAGKRKGKKEFPQEEINELLVFYANRFSHVVRLKGGDPYVFGRGHEEFEFARCHGIEVEVIPGISSALAAPVSSGIPLTRRGVNESFWVITGMLASGKMSADIPLAAKSSASVIILMGMTHLKEIASLFTRERSSAEPVAVIQDATLTHQKTIIGTAEDIYQKVCQNDVCSPAVIVIGKVVDERKVMEVITNNNHSKKILSY